MTSLFFLFFFPSLVFFTPFEAASSVSSALLISDTLVELCPSSSELQSAPSPPQHTGAIPAKGRPLVYRNDRIDCGLILLSRRPYAEGSFSSTTQLSVFRLPAHPAVVHLSPRWTNSLKRWTHSMHSHMFGLTVTHSRQMLYVEWCKDGHPVVQHDSSGAVLMNGLGLTPGTFFMLDRSFGSMAALTRAGSAIVTFFSGAAESEDPFDARDDVLPSEDSSLGFGFCLALVVSFLRRVDSFLVTSEPWSTAGEYRCT